MDIVHWVVWEVKVDNMVHMTGNVQPPAQRQACVSLTDALEWRCCGPVISSHSRTGLAVAWYTVGGYGIAGSS